MDQAKTLYGDFIGLTVTGPVARLDLLRPERLNALPDLGDGAAFFEVCARINSDPDISVAILSGAGKAFSAGGDIKAMQAKTGLFAGSGPEIRNRYRAEVHKIIKSLYDLEVPLIAKVQGPAVGLGCDIAALADLRTACPEARFGVSFLKIGLIPGDGGAWILPRAVGYARAAELLFTAELIDGQTAFDWGLVNRLVPQEALDAATDHLAATIAAQAPFAIRAAKALLRQGRTQSLEAVMEMSAAFQALCHHTDDHREGVTAQIERRPPVFRGH